MAGQGVKLFLSCVSDEFGAYRDELRRKLTRPNVEVKIQEDFKALGGDTLSMLEEYIEHCDAVVHFAGDMTGSTPKDFGVTELLARRPDLKTRPPLGAALEAGAKISYTQWEAWLAIYFRRDLVIAAPGQGFVRGPKIAATEDSEEAQAAHLKRLREIGRYAEVRFTDKNDLVAQIFGSAVIKALVRAEAMPLRQPSNLPFASLGPLFMGRDEGLDKLRATLAADKGAAVVGVTLRGLGGVGKTRLAIEYAWRHEADYSALLFVRADDAATLDANLAALAGADVLDLAEKDAPQDAAKIEAALRWLEANPTWLMILDNVDDENGVASVSKLMARLKGGHVIVTARASNFPAALHKLELDVLDEDAATEFLLERTRDDRAPAEDDAAKARELAQELGGLALGLEQSGAYIATERIGFARYLKLWRENRQKVLDWFDPTLTNYDRSLATTWATSVDRLSPESRRLLDRLAMLAPDPIPDSLLDVAVPAEAADYDAYDARAGLYTYSLITRVAGEDDSAKGFIVHRLVQDFARPAMTEERRGEALREALGWVNDAFVGDPQDVRTWTVLDPLVPHVLAVAWRADEAGIAVPTARLLDRPATLFQAKTRFGEAELLFRRALVIGETTLRPDDPELVVRLNNLAELLRETDRLGEAEPLFRRALAIHAANGMDRRPSPRKSGARGKAQPLNRKHLARIEQVLRIEGSLDAAHQVESRRPVLVLHIGDLFLADAVFAGAGATHGDGAVGEAGGEGFGRVDLMAVAHVDERAHMEIAVADMADDRGDQAGLGDVGERLLDAVGEARDRRAGVGGERPGAGAQRHLRPKAVVARLPEFTAVLRLR